MIYIIAYDIADNERRLRVAKTLGSWGYSIQESVFQLHLDSAMLARVRARLAALISNAEDVIHIYPICSSRADHADILGAAIALNDVGCVGECGEGQRGGGLVHTETRLGACYLETTLELTSALVAVLSLASSVFSEPRPSCRQRVGVGHIRAQS